MRKIGTVSKIVLLMCIVCALIACKVTSEGSGTSAAAPVQSGSGNVIPPKNGKVYHFGYSVGEMSHPTNSYSVILFEARMKELGYEFTVTDAERRSDKQIDDIQALIQRGIDALILLPTDGVAVAPGVDAAYAAGIPVATVLRTMPTVRDKVLTFCAANDLEIGKLAGIWVSTVLNGRGNIVYLSGTPGLSTAEERTIGFHDVIDKFPNIKIIAEQTARYQRTEGMNVMEAILNANRNVEIHALFAANDESLGGAIQAIQASGRRGIKTIGVNLQADAFQRLLNGEQDADITTPMKMVLDAVQSAVDYLHGKPVPPVKYIPVDIVTRENAAAFADQVY